LAPNGHAVMSELSLLSGVKLKSHYMAARTVFDPFRISTAILRTWWP